MEWIDQPHTITKGEKIGTGSFGNIYKIDVPVTYRIPATEYKEKYAINGQSIAKTNAALAGSYIKQTSVQTLAVKEQLADEKCGAMSINELDISRRLVHQNIVNTVGLMSGNYTSLGYFMPLAEKNMDQFLKTNSSYRCLIKVLHDVCNGVSFLHSNGILHLDIKAANVLIYSTTSTISNNIIPTTQIHLVNQDPMSIQAKLSDFGLSIHTIKDFGKIVGKDLVTCTYRAPEVFSTTGLGTEPRRYTKAVDIWSLGILFLRSLSPNLDIFPKELELSRYPNRALGVITNLFKDPLMRRNNIRKLLPQGTHNEIYELVCSMLDWDPTKRPTAKTIIQKMSMLTKIPEMNGILIQTEFQEPVKGTFDDYIAFDTMMKVGIKYNLTVETFFLAVDIYHRCSSITLSVNKDARKHFIAMMSLFIAAKITETQQLGIDFVVASGSYQRFEVVRSETIILRALQGAIYRKNFFTEAKTVQSLIIAFETCRNPTKYTSVNMTKFGQDEIGLRNFENYSMQDFVRHTSYFNNIMCYTLDDILYNRTNMLKLNTLFRKENPV